MGTVTAVVNKIAGKQLNNLVAESFNFLVVNYHKSGFKNNKKGDLIYTRLHDSIKGKGII